MPKWFWWTAGLGGIGFAALLLRKDMTVFSGRPLPEVDAAAFAIGLPGAAQPYADVLRFAGAEYGIDPFLLAAIGMKESGFGQYLTPPGPGGTGDFTSRSWTPYPMPPDGAGWGRGIMQIDYASFKEWCDTHDWRDPETNIRKGADVVARKLKFFTSTGGVSGLTDGRIVTMSVAQAAKRNVSAGTYPDPRPLTGDALARATIAAYNTGEGNVLLSLACGKAPDLTTTRGNYGATVVSQMLAIVRSFDSIRGTV